MITTSGCRSDEPDRVGTVGRHLEDLQIVLAVERDLERLAERALVVDDQDRDRIGKAAAGARSVRRALHHARDGRSLLIPSHARKSVCLCPASRLRSHVAHAHASGGGPGPLGRRAPSVEQVLSSHTHRVRKDAVVWD